MTMRKDGWPLCPRCGEDELYCLLDHSHRMPQGCPGMACYRCSWRGPDPRTVLETTDAPGYSTTALIPRKRTDQQHDDGQIRSAALGTDAPG